MLNLKGEFVIISNNRIFYHYTAGGAKLLKNTVPAIGTRVLTHYIGNIVNGGSTLVYILTEEGRLVANGTPTGKSFMSTILKIILAIAGLPSWAPTWEGLLI